jgi:undecaprenyl phosphate N,N'-diacetylbacillosamine 1-phosphate transferase
MKLINYKILKQIIDFVVALFLLPLIFVLIFIVSILIYIDDKGPVFFNDYRIGINGSKFKMFKFRTMIVNAPDIRLDDGSTYNGKDDYRVTKIGNFLRKTSIDELPQILNVFLGNMSFIGPRPDPMDWLQKYSDEERIFLNVKPGITGYNQAFFRNSADGVQKISNDVFYAKNISFLLDLKILIQTIRTIVLRKNLYVEENRKNEDSS